MTTTSQFEEYMRLAHALRHRRRNPHHGVFSERETLYRMNDIHEEGAFTKQEEFIVQSSGWISWPDQWDAVMRHAGAN